MNINELDDLRRDLRLLADSPHPPLFADPHKARARARRTAVWRRSAVGVSVLASVSVVAAAVALAPGAGSVGSVPEAPGAASSTIPLDATFGLLPPGFKIVSDARFVSGNSLVYAQRKGTRTILSILIDKERSTLGKGFSGPGPAPKVAGRPTVWKADSAWSAAKGYWELDFQAGPDSIGVLTLQNPTKGFDVLGVLTKVAYAIRLGPRPMTFPYKLHGLPDYIKRMRMGRMAQVSLETWGVNAGWSMYDLQEPNVNPATQPSRLEAFAVNEQPIVKDSIFNCAPDTTVAGHPAYYGTHCHSPILPPSLRDGKSAPVQVLCVTGMPNGLQLCLTAIGVKTLASLKPGGGLTGLFERSTFYSSDQSTWTTHPLG